MLALPGTALASSDRTERLLADVALCASLGVRLVLVCGCAAQIDELLTQRQVPVRFAAGFRVTDAAAMGAVMEAAGKVQLSVSATLSKGPPLPAMRKHGEMPSGTRPALRVAAGNYVAAKRRGVVGGIDFGDTGEVRHCDGEALRARLDAGDVALLSNVGYSAAGELLNCATWEVAAHAAAALAADKLILFTDEPATEAPDAAAAPPASRWLPLREAQAAVELLCGPGDGLAGPLQAQPTLGPSGAAEAAAAAAVAVTRRWLARGAPLELAAATAVCAAGVPRCHVVDARREGALLLELYTRDGVGTMVSADRYEGTRPATVADAPMVAALLEPLEAEGSLARRDRAALLADLAAGAFTVVERDGAVVASAALVPYPAAACAEVAAFAVDPRYRGAGRGDALLEYVEQIARSTGLRRLFLLTTRAADWFQARGFEAAGRAAGSPLLPAGRRVDASRNSLLFVKDLGPGEADGGL